MTDQPQRIELGNNVFLRFEEQRKKNSQTQTCRITEPFPVLNANDIDYATFYEQFLITNRPCLFISSLTDDWNCRNDWIDKTEVFPRINFDFLERTYGKSNVGVVDCEKFTQEFTPQQTYNMNKDTENCMPLSEFISYWKDYINNGYPDSMKLQYLKDWHILRDSNNYRPYVTPPYFRSDWLNEVWGLFDDGDDFIFCYMGPKGTWTPFHSDVYESFSWSANIIGTKKWHIYPPGGENRFKNSKTKDVKYDYAHPGVKDVDYYEVIQQAGEVIFIPSGWHHVVWNLEDTISINHNWMNGANVLHIWAKLKEALQEVKLEIADLKNCDDFAENCQQILKSNHGMDYPLFLSLLQSIEENRKTKSCPSLGPVHRNFDLYILNLMQMTLCNDSDVNEL